MTSQFLSSQLKPKRDNENCSLGAIFLSHVGLKVEFPFFSPSWKGTISQETAFFCGCAARLHLKSFPFNKQTNTFQGRSGLKGALRVGRKKTTSNAGDSKQLTKKNQQLEKRGIQTQKKRREEERKKGRTCCFVKAVRARVRACWRALVLDQRRSSLRLARRRRSLVTVFVTCRGKIPGGGRVGDRGGGWRGRAGGAKLRADVWEQTPPQSGLEATLQCG